MSTDYNAHEKMEEVLRQEQWLGLTHPVNKGMLYKLFELRDECRDSFNAINKLIDNLSNYWSPLTGSPADVLKLTSMTESLADICTRLDLYCNSEFMQNVSKASTNNILKELEIRLEKGENGNFKI